MAATDQDFEDARRGFVAALEPARIEAADGRVVWDSDAYAFFEDDCPPTANPSLWRQGRLTAIQGLFEIAPGFFCVRGLDLSNMEIVEGEDGIIVIDPLISVECAAAALALYREHRGDRPVTGVVFTHSHVDHFGGVAGVVSTDDVVAGRVPILAPEGFLEHAVSENVYAGPAMTRRAAYMYGALLEPGPGGQIGCGLGLGASTGRNSILAPTLEVTRTGQEETVDGVRLVFQLTPGTEAPAEMNFHFPDHRVLCVAENATRTMHNTLTLRGALVRDPHVWARYLDETIELFGAATDVLFAVHHWPTWGNDRVIDLLRKQRDLYGYLHDQTLRLLNKGLTGAEIAERFELPPSLAREWHCRGYYGSVSHNVKAIYQRYMGWFDGNPAHLWEHPPAERARRYVEAIGGIDAVLERAGAAADEGDLRWAAELANHAVFADPEHGAARELQAQVLERLGHGSENATWRNFFLTGAKELREGVARAPALRVAPEMVAQLPVAQILDGMALRIDGPRAFETEISIVFELADTGEAHTLTLENAVLTHRPGRREGTDATLRLERAALDELIAETSTAPDLLAAGRLEIEGDGTKLAELFGLMDEPDPNFAIVTP
jgi:alkyl sulfatase BDS1-like metallo-beta-lactamase superfamily hydrolase